MVQDRDADTEFRGVTRPLRFLKLLGLGGDFSPVALNTAALLAGRGFRMGISLALAVVLARSLGPGDYGKWVALTALAALFSPWVALGLDNIAIRECSRGRVPEAKCLGALLLFRFPAGVLALLGVVLAWGLLHGFFPPVLTLAGLVGAVYLVNALAESGVVAYRVREKMWYETLANAGKDISVLLLVLLALRLLPPPERIFGVALAYLGSALIFLCLVALILRRRFVLPAFDFDAKLFRGFLGAGLPLALAVFCNNFQDVSRVLVEALLGSRSAGLFGAAGLPLRGAELLAVSFAGAFFPRLSRGYHHPGRGLADLRRASETALAAGLAWSLAASLLPGHLLRAVFGEEYAAAAPALSLLGPACALVFLNHIFFGAMVAAGKERGFAGIMAAAAAGNLLLSFCLARSLGITGAALAFLSIQLILAAVLYLRVGKAFGGPPLDRGMFALVPGFLAGAGAVYGLARAGVWPWAALGAGEALHLFGAVLTWRRRVSGGGNAPPEGGRG